MTITIHDRLTLVLFVLARDTVPPGKIEDILYEAEGRAARRRVDFAARRLPRADEAAKPLMEWASQAASRIIGTADEFVSHEHVERVVNGLRDSGDLTEASAPSDVPGQTGTSDGRYTFTSRLRSFFSRRAV